MNLFLTGEFKQCKTGKRVLEDYLKNYNQFNQGLGLNSDIQSEDVNFIENPYK